MKVLLIDNFDSFTYNIVHYLEVMVDELRVKTNIDVEKDDVLWADKLVVSPGPGLPKEAGKLMEMIHYSVEKQKPILGVCLGMQAIAEFLGGTLYNLDFPIHGRSLSMNVLKTFPIFENCPNNFEVGLYHSWAVKENSGNFEKLACLENGVLMSICNFEKQMYGVQFHPESVLTENGKQILHNFVMHK